MQNKKIELNDKQSNTSPSSAKGSTKKTLDKIEINPKTDNSPKSMYERTDDTVAETSISSLVAEMKQQLASEGLLDEAVLNLQQRLKRRTIMRQYKTKIAAAKERAERKMADQPHLKARAEKAARNVARKRFAGQRGVQYQELSPSDKISVDKLIDKKGALIKRIASRLLPVIRKKEIQRLASFRSGAAMKPQHTPATLMKEDDMMTFAEAVAPRKRGRPASAATLAKRSAAPKNKKMDDEDDYGPDNGREPDQNIIMQLHKAISMDGKKEVNFDQGGNAFVKPKHAEKALSHYNSLKKPAEKLDFIKKISTSHTHLKQAINEDADLFAIIENVMDRIDEDSMLSEEVVTGLKKKAEKSGMPLGVLKKVYKRGMSSYKSALREDTTQQQWAFARVNSFIAGGKTTTTTDADLWEKVNEAKTPQEKFKAGLKKAGYDPDAGAKRLTDLIAKQKAERAEHEKKYGHLYAKEEATKGPSKPRTFTHADYPKAVQKSNLPKIGRQPKDEYDRKVDTYLKKKYNKEEVTLDEAHVEFRIDNREKPKGDFKSTFADHEAKVSDQTDKATYVKVPSHKADSFKQTMKSKHGTRVELDEAAIPGLSEKAKKSGVSLSTLRTVYKRGVAAWNSGHRPGTTPQQWGMARVNSYVTKGKGTYGGADKDLHEADARADKTEYHKGLSDSTAKARVAHWKKMDKLSDSDPSAYEPAPGDATAKTKESEHTKKYKAMFGEAVDNEHPIVKEYHALKKHDIKTLRSVIQRQSRVVDTSGFKNKDHAISHILRSKHGNKKVAQAFGLNEEVNESDNTQYAIKHKMSKKILSTHKDLSSAKDEWKGIDKDERHFYQVVSHSKPAKSFSMKEDAQIDEAAWGKDKAANLKAALNRHSEKAIAANKAGDDAAVKAHQSKMNMIKNMMTKMAKEEVQIDEISTQLKTAYRQKAIADIRALRPHAEKGEYKDLAKNVMKKRQAGVNLSMKRNEDIELDEAVKLNSKVSIHAPGKSYHGEVGHVGEIRHGAFKGAPKTYTVDYGNRQSVQLDKKNIKVHKEVTEGSTIKNFKRFVTGKLPSDRASAEGEKMIDAHSTGDKAAMMKHAKRAEKFDRLTNKPVNEDSATHLRTAAALQAKGKPQLASIHKKIAIALSRGDSTTAQGYSKELSRVKSSLSSQKESIDEAIQYEVIDYSNMKPVAA